MSSCYAISRQDSKLTICHAFVLPLSLINIPSVYAMLLYITSRANAVRSSHVFVRCDTVGMASSSSLKAIGNHPFLLVFPHVSVVMEFVI